MPHHRARPRRAADDEGGEGRLLLLLGGAVCVGAKVGKGRGKGGRPRAVRSAHPRSSSRRFGLLLLPWHGHCSHCELVGAPVAYSQPHMRLSRRLTLVRSVAVGSNDAGEGGPREGSTCVGRLTYPARFGDKVARGGRECGARTVSVSLASRPSRPGNPLGPPGRRGACRRKGEGCVRKGSSQRMSWRLPARALARGARMATGGGGGSSLTASPRSVRRLDSRLLAAGGEGRGRVAVGAVGAAAPPRIGRRSPPLVSAAARWCSTTRRSAPCSCSMVWS